MKKDIIKVKEKFQFKKMIQHNRKRVVQFYRIFYEHNDSKNGNEKDADKLRKTEQKIVI